MAPLPTIVQTIGVAGQPSRLRRGRKRILPKPCRYKWRTMRGRAIMQASRRELLTPHGSRIASAVWSYFGGSPSLRIGSRSSITATNCTVLAASSRIAAAISTKSVMVSTTLPFRPTRGDRSGKGCGTAPPPRFVACILPPQPCTATVRKARAKPREPCAVPTQHSARPCGELTRI